MFSQRTNWRLSPNALTRAIEEARASGQRILDLTISNPTEAGVRPDAEIVLAALANPEAMHYDAQPRGLLEARQAVSRYYRESHEVDLDPERLILTCSAIPATRFLYPRRATRCSSFWPISPTLNSFRIHCSTITVGRSISIRSTKQPPSGREPSFSSILITRLDPTFLLPKPRRSIPSAATAVWV